VSVAAVVGTLAAWQQGHDLQDTLILDRNRHHVHDALRDAVPSARHHLPQGTYLSWVDVSALGIDIR
ncbi:MAG TPA: aminotransferase, partial [Mycobacterium sp.]|nr:aminotransferase [Mycobacterium sp.]